MKPETWDIYDINKQPTGQTMIRGDQLKPGQYHLVIHICYFNEKNQMLIQRRALDKDNWQGFWDISVGGAVRTQETSQMAAARESLEELGITYAFDGVLPRLTLSFSRGFDDVFLVPISIDIDALSFHDHEVCDAKWASESDIIDMIHADVFVPIHTPEFIHFVFRLKDMQY